MSERRLIQCDSCEETIELVGWDEEDDTADTIADHGWYVVVTPSDTDERLSDSHFCSVRCIGVWATAGDRETV